MKLVQVAEQNKKYYTKEFIHGFNTGAKTQYEADRKERLAVAMVTEESNSKCADCTGGYCEEECMEVKNNGDEE